MAGNNEGGGEIRTPLRALDANALRSTGTRIPRPHPLKKGASAGLASPGKRDCKTKTEAVSTYHRQPGSSIQRPGPAKSLASQRKNLPNAWPNHSRGNRQNTFSQTPVSCAPKSVRQPLPQASSSTRPGVNKAVAVFERVEVAKPSPPPRSTDDSVAQESSGQEHAEELRKSSFAMTAAQSSAADADERAESPELIFNPQLLRSPLAYLEENGFHNQVLQHRRLFQLKGEEALLLGLCRGYPTNIRSIRTSANRSPAAVDEAAGSPLMYGLLLENGSCSPLDEIPSSLETISRVSPAFEARWVAADASWGGTPQEFAKSVLASPDSNMSGDVPKGSATRVSAVGIPSVALPGAGLAELSTTPFLACLVRTGPSLTPDSTLAAMPSGTTPLPRCGEIMGSISFEGSPLAIVDPGGSCSPALSSRLFALGQGLQFSRVHPQLDSPYDVIDKCLEPARDVRWTPMIDDMVSMSNSMCAERRGGETRVAAELPALETTLECSKHEPESEESSSETVVAFLEEEIRHSNVEEITRALNGSGSGGQSHPLDEFGHHSPAMPGLLEPGPSGRVEIYPGGGSRGMSSSPEGVTFVMPDGLHSQRTPTLIGCPLLPEQNPLSHPLGLNQQTDIFDTPHKGDTVATPLLTWNPAYMDKNPALSGPGMQSEAMRLPSALELAMTATIPAQPDSLEARISALPSAPGNDLNVKAAVAHAETRTPYEVMLAYLTGGHYVSPENSCACQEGMEGDSPSTPVTQRASTNISAVACKGTLADFQSREEGSSISPNAITPLRTPGSLGRGNLTSWLARSGLMNGVLLTPARHDLKRYKVLWDKAKENLDLHARIETLQQDIAEAEATAEEENLQNWDKLMEHCRVIEEENAALRHKLLKTDEQIQVLELDRTSALQLAAEQQRLAAEDAERAKEAAAQLLDLANQAAMITVIYEEEKEALLKELNATRSQLNAILGKENALISPDRTEEQRVDFELQLQSARLAHQEAVDRCQAAQLAAEAAAVEKVRLNKDLGDAQRMLVALLQSSAEDSRAEMLGLCNELKMAHATLFGMEMQQSRSATGVATDGTRSGNEMDNAAVCDLVHELVALVAEEEEPRHEAGPMTDGAVDAAGTPFADCGRSRQMSPDGDASQSRVYTPALSPVARALVNAAKFFAENNPGESLPAYSPVPRPEMIQDDPLPCDTGGLEATESPASGTNTMARGGGVVREPCNGETVLVVETRGVDSTPTSDAKALPDIAGAHQPPAKEQSRELAALLPSLPFRGRAASPNGVVAFFGSHRVVVKKPARTRFQTPNRAMPSANGINQTDYGGTPTAAWHEITSRLNQLRANLEEAQKHLHDPQPGQLQTPSSTRNYNHHADSPCANSETHISAVTLTREQASPTEICETPPSPAPRSTTSSASNNSAAFEAEDQAVILEQSPPPSSDQSISASASCSMGRDRPISDIVSYAADNEDVDASSRRGCIISHATASTPLQQQDETPDSGSVYAIHNNEREAQWSVTSSCASFVVPERTVCSTPESVECVQKVVRKGRWRNRDDKEFRRRAAALNVHISPYFRL